MIDIVLKISATEAHNHLYQTHLFANLFQK